VLVAAGAFGFSRDRRSQHADAVPIREAGIFYPYAPSSSAATLNANTTFRSPVEHSRSGVLMVRLPDVLCMARPFMAEAIAGLTDVRRGGFVALTLGVSSQVSHFSTHMAFMWQRMDAAQIVALYDRMGETSERAGWTAPIIASDSMRDYLVAGALTAVYYERHGALVNFVGTLGATGSVSALPRDVMLAQLAQSSFLVLTHHPDAVEPPYPVVEAIESIRPEMETLAKDHMTHLDTYQVFGRQVDLYVRPVEGAR
jgi:hypothetical protein